MARKGSGLLYTLLLVFAVAPVVWLLIKTRREDVPQIHRLLERDNTGGAVACGPVIDQCRATAEAKVSQCSQGGARTKIESLLSKPLQAEGCLDIEQRLNSQCARGCELDYMSLLVVPGDLEISLEPGEGEGCLARGQQVVTVHGKCR